MTSPASRQGSSADTAWRLVSARHVMHFTGSSLDNGGSVTVVPVDLPLGRTGLAPSTLGDGTTYHVLSGTVNGVNQFTHVAPARATCSILQVPRVSEYQQVRTIINCTNTHIAPFVPKTDEVANFGYAPSLHTKVYDVTYSGLAASASVTIESDICVQSLITEDNEAYPFAQPSEAANQSYLQSFLSSLNAVAANVFAGSDFSGHVKRVLRDAAVNQSRSALLAVLGA